MIIGGFRGRVGKLTCLAVQIDAKQLYGVTDGRRVKDRLAVA